MFLNLMIFRNVPQDLGSQDPSFLHVWQYGQEPDLHPIFRVCRAWVWCAHRTRMRLLGLEYLL